MLTNLAFKTRAQKQQLKAECYITGTMGLRLSIDNAIGRGAVDSHQFALLLFTKRNSRQNKADKLVIKVARILKKMQFVAC